MVTIPMMSVDAMTTTTMNVAMGVVDVIESPLGVLATPETPLPDLPTPVLTRGARLGVLPEARDGGALAGVGARGRADGTRSAASNGRR